MRYEKENDFQGEQRRTRRVHSLGRSSPHDNPNPEDQFDQPQVASGGSANFVFLDAHAANVTRARTPLAVKGDLVAAQRQTFWAYTKRLESLGSFGGKVLDTW